MATEYNTQDIVVARRRRNRRRRMQKLFLFLMLLLLAGIILTFFRRAGLWPLGTAAYLTLRLLTLAKRTGE